MGIKKFINSLKNFGDTISSAAENVFDEVNKTFDGLDPSKLTPRAGEGNRAEAGRQSL